MTAPISSPKADIGAIRILSEIEHHLFAHPD